MGRKARPNLIVSLTGGLGNQLFQVSNAIRCGVNSRIILAKDFGRPRLNSLGEPEINSFTLPFSHQFSTNLEAPFIIRKILGHTLRIAEHPKDNEKNPYYFCLLKFTSSIFLTIYYGKFTLVKTIRDEMPKLGSSLCNYLLLGYFQFMPAEYSAMAKHILQKIDISIRTEQLEDDINYALTHQILFVHIRLTDYLKEPKIGLLSGSYFSQAVRQTLEKTQSKEIWVFSDDHTLAKDTLPVLGQVKIRYISESEYSVAESFELLRCGSHYVLSNSTFGWWAAFLSKKINPSVVIPNPWFRSLVYDPSIYLLDWQQMTSQWSE